MSRRWDKSGVSAGGFGVVHDSMRTRAAEDAGIVASVGSLGGIVDMRMTIAQFDIMIRRLCAADGAGGPALHELSAVGPEGRQMIINGVMDPPEGVL